MGQYQFSLKIDDIDNFNQLEISAIPISAIYYILVCVRNIHFLSTSGANKSYGQHVFVFVSHSFSYYFAISLQFQLTKYRTKVYKSKSLLFVSLNKFIEIILQ